MSYQEISLLISAVIFGLYCAYCLQKFGLTRSISATFYRFHGLKRYLYTAFMWGFSVPMMIAGETPLFFLACAGIAFTGTAADSKRSKMAERVHMIGVYVGITAGLVSLWIDFEMLWLSIIGVLGIITMWANEVKHHTYWIEVWAYIIIWIGIWIQL